MKFPFQMKKISILMGGLGLAFVPVWSHAGDWIITPAVTLEQTYTDNVYLTEVDEESESVTRLSPSISAYREGARARVDFNYAPEFRHYWEDTEEDDVIHFLRAEGDVEMLEDYLFLDGWATADLASITSRGRTGVSGLTGSSDFTEVYTAGLSPYFRTRLGSFSVFEARYSADAVYYDEGDDNLGQQVDLVLGSGTAFSNQIWEISAKQSQVDYDSLEEDNEIKQVQAEYVQNLTSKWALSFVAGYEEFNLALNPDIDDTLWRAGVIYTPNSRTRLAIGGGERAFGDDYYLDFSHRSRITIWTANFARDFTSARGELLQPRLFLREDEFGNFVRDPVLESPVTTQRQGSSDLSADFYVADRFSTRFTIATGRSNYYLGASYTERQYEDSTLDSEDLGATTGFSRDFSRLVNGFIDVRWTDHEEEALHYEQTFVRVGGTYLLGVSTTLGFTLAYLDRDAEEVLASYTESQGSLFVTHSF
jgi:uncharacterized protein (PEP-CTERM system associated)